MHFLVLLNLMHLLFSRFMAGRVMVSLGGGWWEVVAMERAAVENVEYGQQ